jgi:putative oxidoreductase
MCFFALIVDLASFCTSPRESCRMSALFRGIGATRFGIHAAEPSLDGRFTLRSGEFDMELSRPMKALSWTLQIVAAVILLQTLFFKFSGAPESVYIFTTLGMEPWGRIGSGVAELVAAVLLLVPRTAVLGAILSLGIISGAILSHLTQLGITLPAVGDNGELFALAVVVFVASAAVVLIRRREIPVLGPRFAN